MVAQNNANEQENAETCDSYNVKLQEAKEIYKTLQKFIDELSQMELQCSTLSIKINEFLNEFEMLKMKLSESIKESKMKLSKSIQMDQEEDLLQEMK